MKGHNYAGPLKNIRCRNCGKLHINPRLGIAPPLTPSLRLQIRNKLKGRHISPRTEFKNGHLGNHSNLSAEHKRKISATLKAKGILPPLTFGQIPWNKGKTFSPELRHKLSIAHLGQKPTLEQRIKQSLSIQGPNHWNWQGGLSTQKRGNGWTRLLRKAIRQRDNNTCQVCGLRGNHLDVHHIDLDRRNHNPNNLITFCHPCHIRIHTNHPEKTVVLFQNYQMIRHDSRGDGAFQK